MLRGAISSALVCSLLALAGLATPASAVLIGDFESDLDGWSASGSVSQRTSLFGITPTNGIGMLQLSTGGGTVTDATLDGFFGFASGTIDGLSPSGNDAIEGSAASLVLSGSAGDVLTFDFNFLTRETIADADFARDFGFSTLRSNEQGEVVLDDALLMTRLATSNGNWSQTGWQSVSYTFQTTGTFTLGFGVVDVFDNRVASRMLLDNIRKSPEPSTGLMLGSGLLMLAGRRRPGRRRA